jgi:hypothetical protein
LPFGGATFYFDGCIGKCTFFLNNGKIPISDVLNPSSGLAKFQQQLVGQVLDAKGQPLSGVEVRNLKNATVTVTDQEGRFKLTGSVSDQIQFRLIGFNTKVVSGKDVQALVLDASENALDEVVVVGYGKKRQLDRCCGQCQF